MKVTKEHATRHVVPRSIARLVVLIAISGGVEATEPAWSGRGRYRMLAEVSDVPLAGRNQDVLVAALAIDFSAWLQAQTIAGKMDPASLQVQRIDSTTGKALEYGAAVSDAHPADAPCRWDDAQGAASDLSRVGSAIDHDRGLIPTTNTPGKARLFNRIPVLARGRLVWSHRQVGSGKSLYAIYFDVRDESAPMRVGPAPWIGDVDVLRRARGESLGGFTHFTVTAGDLNGDGLFDLVAGTEKGDVMWFPNRGRLGQPQFDGCELLEDDTGPVDCGWYAAPFLYDWNSDGLLDLLCGTRTNVILWWANVGTSAVPQWAHRGFVQADGQRLAVPDGPVAEDGNGIFHVDYYNQPWIGDGNGDGCTDVVTGGYTTGRIFHFRGTGRQDDGTPRLSGPQPVEADGAPIDTVWAAAPLLHDFDHDGKLDLLTGSWFWTGIQRRAEAGEGDYLAYYANVGSTESPRFQRRPFPKAGEFPSGAIARPGVVDWNADGLPDLIVSDAGGNVYAFLNIGQRDAPRWDVSSPRLTIPWGFAKDLDIALPMADLDSNGTPEFMLGNHVYTLRGGVHAPESISWGIATAGGVPLEHPGPGYGDGYAYTWLDDWNGDGRADLLWGTQQGNIYLHLKADDHRGTSFEAGELLRLSSGEPLRVGPPVVSSPDEATDFTILQGSRIIFTTVDFDVDGRLDLLVSETYGNIWLFRQMEVDGRLTIAPGVLLHKLPGRTESLTCYDWNHDGLPDLLLGGPPDQPVQLLLNKTQAGQAAVDRPQSIPMPYVFWGAKPRVVDWNGDGDADLMIQSEFFSFFAERSFLERGYQPAQLVTPAGQTGVIQTRDE